MSASRDAILKSVRSQVVLPTVLPSLDQSWTRYPDPFEQFARVLEFVGGTYRRVRTVADVDAELAAFPQFATAAVRCSAVPGAGRPTVDAATLTDPHQLETVDWATLPGQLAVAENAAVWVNDEKLAYRAVYFIAQHLALVVPASGMRHNLHEAFQELSFSGPQFGAFISGPSKTADIEQSLVIGAHGPRSHVVFLVDEL